MKEFFVVDVGNTRTKWAIADRRRIIKEHEFPTSQFAEIKGKKIPRLDLPDHPCGAIISCVVPAALPGVKACLKSMAIPKPLVVSPKLDLGIGIKYPKPFQIGADRLVNSVAASFFYGAPAIVVDFGTAVTFDVLSPKKEYLGGAIAPGLAAMNEYLHKRTALLPHFTLAEPKRAIGNDTVEAMRVGAVVGYRGLIREILSAVCRELKKNSGNHPIQIIATGGHCELIASKIPEVEFVNPRLTIEGLRILYDRNVPTPLLPTPYVPAPLCPTPYVPPAKK